MLLEGDNIVKPTIPDLIRHFKAFKTSWGKLKVALTSLKASAPSQPTPTPAPAPAAAASGASAPSIVAPEADDTEQLAELEAQMEHIYNTAIDGKYTPAQVFIISPLH